MNNSYYGYATNLLTGTKVRALKQRNVQVNLDTYVRMAMYALSSQNGDLRYTRLIIPRSIQEDLITYFEGNGLNVLPQWYDDIDRHDNAVYLTVWMLEPVKDIPFVD